MIEFAGSTLCKHLFIEPRVSYYCGEPSQVIVLIREQTKGGFVIYHQPSFRCERHAKQLNHHQNQTIIYCCKHLVLKAAREIIKEKDMPPCTVCDPPTKYHLDGSPELWEKIYGKAKVLQSHS